jgi:hypothetical protein
LFCHLLPNIRHCHLDVKQVIFHSPIYVYPQPLLPAAAAAAFGCDPPGPAGWSAIPRAFSGFKPARTSLGCRVAEEAFHPLLSSLPGAKNGNQAARNGKQYFECVITLIAMCTTGRRIADGKS